MGLFHHLITHLITQLYLVNEADIVFLAGDNNARIGSINDTYDG